MIDKTNFTGQNIKPESRWTKQMKPESRCAKPYGTIIRIQKE